MTMENHEHHESDLGAAAFLVVRGFRLLGLAANDGKRFSFRFADPDGAAAEAAMAYLQGDSAPARALISAQKDLKNLLYARKRNGDGDGHYKQRD